MIWNGWLAWPSTSRIEEYCKHQGLEVAGRLCYDPLVVKALVSKKSVVEYHCGSVTEEMKKMWIRVEEKLNQQ